LTKREVLNNFAVIVLALRECNSSIWDRGIMLLNKLKRKELEVYYE
jgi:hypothetical protein